MFQSGDKVRVVGPYEYETINDIELYDSFLNTIVTLSKQTESKLFWYIKEKNMVMFKESELKPWSQQLMLFDI